ncbi:AhpC/TSA family protein [Pedobacter sp. KBS0701]|uniref:TlpA disulfide reductase family protein n=1 Tax=Pedobacter sp. KBS0701 TaxID=2578106 RepID=UPI00110E1572|nr:TlpA disulfide reductase family protein [Pedobacter sp. KBS0701]QDW23971.1 AhpC/TSA family protein [Pedobacter sp. KBS0701]
MLKILVTAVIGLAAFSVNAQTGFSIKGKIPAKYDGQKVMLEYRTTRQEVRDSAIVRNGSFSFKGKVNAVVKVYLNLKPTEKNKETADNDDFYARNYQTFFLENTNISIVGTQIGNATIKGGPAQSDYLILKSRLKSLEAKQMVLNEQVMRSFRNKKDDSTSKDAPNEFAPQLQRLYSEIGKIQNAFIQQHPDSYVSLDLINERNDGAVELAKLKRDLKLLSPRMKNTAMGKNLQVKLAMAEKTGIGQQALDFTQNNTEGKPVTLSSLRGKYVLVDFWASWCAPCREENPTVVKAYEKFKDKNFEIISISLDDKKEPWLKAIEADGLPWIQLSDLKGWKNSVARLYGITSVPQNLLLDPNGKIVAKNLRGEELQMELDKIFN